MRKMGITIVVFAIAMGAVFGVAALASDDVALPRAITESSSCPAVGCASGRCHSFDNVPEPDGLHDMTCPEASCASVECHAWETLADRYRQASDASLTLWIVVPVAIVLALVLVTRKL